MIKNRLVGILLCACLSFHSFASPQPQEAKNEETKEWTLLQKGSLALGLSIGAKILKTLWDFLHAKQDKHPGSGDGQGAQDGHGNGGFFFQGLNGEMSGRGQRSTAQSELEEQLKKLLRGSKDHSLEHVMQLLQAQMDGVQIKKSRTHTTSVMRYPHLISYLMNHHVLSVRPRTVLILGPGLLHDGSVPQIHELMPFLGNDNIFVVDNSQEVLDAIQHSHYQVQDVALSVINQDSNFDMDSEQERRELLNYILNQIPVNLNGNIQAVHSDFASLDLEDESTDLIFGTLSLIYAFKSLSSTDEHAALARRFLHALTIGGVLYTDRNLAEIILDLYEGDATFETDLIPSLCQNRVCNGPSLKFHDSGIGEGLAHASTTDIIAIRRKS